jgi:hypothetical protein
MKKSEYSKSQDSHTTLQSSEQAPPRAKSALLMCVVGMGESMRFLDLDHQMTWLPMNSRPTPKHQMLAPKHYFF